MSNAFLTFEKYSDPELAETIASQLGASGIASVVVNEGPVFDPTFANNNFEPTIHLKLLPADFNKARQVLEKNYQEQLASMDPDYYLFSFSDAELLDLVQHSDEWGPLDYALAKKILADHGKPVSSEQELTFHEERIKVLAQTETPKPFWVIAGYVLAFLGSLLGFILGYILAYLRKTLPNGQQVYVYSTWERKHGKRILIISAIFLPLWILFLIDKRGY
jgi:hypothetical protein